MQTTSSTTPSSSKERILLRRTADELAFLPAALEIQETPPNPAGRAVLCTLIVMVLFTLVWSVLGYVDIVAVAQGKIVPSDRVKVIQPLGTGQVRAIHVRDGQQVSAGEVLIELDATLAQADRDRLTVQLRDDEAALARQQAFAAWLQTGRRPSQQLGTELQRTLLHQLILEHRARLAGIDQSLERRRAEADATRRMVEKGERTLPMITSRAASVSKLADQSLVAKNSALELEQQRIEAEQDLAAQRANLLSVSAAINELTEQRRAVHAEAQRTTTQTIAELQQRVSAARQELIKAQSLATQQTLLSPVAGVVQQLKVHTLGGVVTPAEPLMVIVPNDAAIEIEALVLNRDIGFVNEGLPATVKIDAFPFTRYGTLVGELVTVSRDAASDEKLGLVYPSRVKLQRSSLRIDTRDIALTPGMAVTVELKTGRRRLIDYFVAPVQRAVDESIRER